MSTDLSRRTLLSATALLGLAPIAYGRAPQPASTPSLDHFPRQPADLVRETVGASHRDLARVRELVTGRPSLARCAYDWGFGDWESALGAASHVGNRDIALFLIEQGARPDLFTFAMLGDLAAVKAGIEARPGIQRTHGPHGITLLAHARAGGEQAKGVYDYLLSLKDADEGYKPQPMPEDEMKRLTGTYTAVEQGVTFEVTLDKGVLLFQRKPQTRLRLFHVGNGAFHPAGAPGVRITFGAGLNGPATATIRDHDIVVTAVATP